MKDFERTIKQQLEAVREQPDDDLWEKIARQQIVIHRRNTLRKWLLRGSAGLLVLLFWWISTSENAHSTNEPSSINFTEVQKANFSNSEKQHFNYMEENVASSYPITSDSETHRLTDTDFSSKYQALPSKTALFVPSEPTSGGKSSTHLPHPPAAVQDKTSQKLPTLLPAVEMPTGIPQAALPDVFPNKNKPRNLEYPTPITSDENLQIIEKQAVAEVLPTSNHPFISSEISTATPQKTVLAAEDLLNRPARANNLRVGLQTFEGRLLKPNTSYNLARQVGVVLESHIDKNWWLMSGAQLGVGEYRVPFSQFSNVELEDFLQDYPVHPSFARDFEEISISFQELSFPLGISFYQNTGLKKMDWLLRGTIRPSLVEISPIFLISGNTQTHVNGQYERKFKLGWAGLHAGFQYRIFGRLRLEVASFIEHTLGYLTHERRNLTQFGVQIGLKWGG